MTKDFNNVDAVKATQSVQDLTGKDGTSKKTVKSFVGAFKLDTLRYLALAVSLIQTSTCTCCSLKG